eukprot:1161171-Pelagomonas_calceolata.AAC.11
MLSKSAELKAEDAKPGPGPVSKASGEVGEKDQKRTNACLMQVSRSAVWQLSHLVLFNFPALTVPVSENLPDSKYAMTSVR